MTLDRTAARPTSADRSRSTQWEDPAITAGLLAHRDGIALLSDMRDGHLPMPPVAMLMGYVLEEVAAGHAVFRLGPGEHLYNPNGTVHGGVLSTLLDSAAGCAVHSLLPAGVGYTSVDLQVKFLRPVTIGTGAVRATGRVVHQGRRLMLADAVLTDAHGRLHATATSTCILLDPSGPR